MQQVLLLGKALQDQREKQALLLKKQATAGRQQVSRVASRKLSIRLGSGATPPTSAAAQQNPDTPPSGEQLFVCALGEDGDRSRSGPALRSLSSFRSMKPSAFDRWGLFSAGDPL